MQARGTVDAGAAFNAALDPIIDELFRAAHRAGRHEPRDAYAFDAVMELARRARGDDRPATTASAPTSTGSQPAATTTATTAATPGDSPTGRAAPARRATPGNPRYLALLRVDMEALARGRVEGNELCEIAGVGPVPARVARKLLGESIVKLVLTNGVDVANVTNLGRGPSAAQKVALLWRSPACTNSRCSHTLAIQHDHRQRWVEVHETVLDNIDRLCPPCHRRKTHEGWALVAGTGRRPLVPPGHSQHPANATGPPVTTGPSNSHGVDLAADDAA